MRASGKVNPVSVVLLLAMIAGGWWLFTYVPIYWDNLRVKEIAGGSALSYLTGSEEGAVREVIRRANSTRPEEVVGWHFEVDDDGLETMLPGLGLTEDNVSVTFDEATRTVTVHISYDRTVELKPFERRAQVHFEVEKKTALK